MKQVFYQFILIGCLLISAQALFAQTTGPDVLHRLDRTTQNVRVKEITEVEVFYTDLNAPAAIRKIRKAELWKVVFGDGTSDVYNEPKVAKPVTETPFPKPTVTSTSARPNSTPAPPPANRVSQPIGVGGSQSVDLGTFAAGRRALSYGLTLSGTSTTNKNSRTTTTNTTNNIGLSALYQKFTRDNVSIGGGLTLGFTGEKNKSTTAATTAETVESAPSIAIMGQTRRYLPVASHVAFYGFSSAELALRWYKYKSGSIEDKATQQQLSLELGAGLAYLLNERWSIDFNASLLGLTLNRVKDEEPGSKAAVDLSLTGAGVIPSFSLFLTRYF
ncbi:outer membrane beta-barrel protein [Spirosoma validum]|uniref:Outer membrane beta-barrel protein n=1 Tax=Spirosoma validum TaxID=2771355 RepID=A0A927AY69_9BACT|nr:outer membrane beta-barrel protein [Spirosoma validum]MBD2751847.1 outer membrane beta-barrel protein [Spirosoma validum]